MPFAQSHVTADSGSIRRAITGDMYFVASLTARRTGFGSHPGARRERKLASGAAHIGLAHDLGRDRADRMSILGTAEWEHTEVTLAAHNLLLYLNGQTRGGRLDS
jgi:hypothetical protein